MSASGQMRPAVVCGYLLAALDASEGRRRKRKRDTTPDAIGLTIKRELLEAVMRDDPDPETFEGWLLARSLATPEASGSVRSIALAVLAECVLARESPAFSGWLSQGAPSDDAI